VLLLVLLFVLLLVLVPVVVVVVVVVLSTDSQYCVPDVQSPVWSAIAGADVKNIPMPIIAI